MHTALTFLATSLTLGILLFFAQRQHHKIVDDSEIYRYPPLLLNVAALGVPLYGLFATIIYTRSPEVPRGPGFISVLIFVFGTLILVNTVAYLYLRSFEIDVRESQMVVTIWGRRKTIAWESVASIRLVTGRQGLGEMRLFDNARQLILKAGSSIQDFEDLVWSVKSNTRRPGVVVFERDREGKWSESQNP